MRHIARLIIAVALLPLCGTATGSSPPMVFNHITLQEGLSQGTVHDVLQDSLGLMWFATENGLNRYDGYSITRYTRNRLDPDGLPSDFVWQMAEDASGDLWLATKGGGLVRWKRQDGTFQSFSHHADVPGSISSNRARSLAIGADGHVWVGTRGGGLNRLDPATGKFRTYRHDPNDPATLASDSVLSLLIDGHGWLWVGTERGLSFLDPVTGNVTNYRHDPQDPTSLSEDRVGALHLDDDGVLWVGTQRGGLNRLSPGSSRFERFRHATEDSTSLSHDTVRAIFRDADHRLWVGTMAGLDLYQPDTGSFRRYARDPAAPRSLSGSGVLSIMQDRGGMLWVGTSVGGVSRWNPRSWSLGHYKSDWLRDAPVTAIADDGRGHVWIGTLGAGLYRLNLETDEVVHYTQSNTDDKRLPDNRVMSLLYDRGGLLWIGTMTAGLVRLDTLTGTTRRYAADPSNPDAISANGIMSLFEDKDGRIWAGTFGGGACSLDRQTELFQCYRHDPADPTTLSAARATAIEQDLNGVMWIGTDAGGLNRVDTRDGSIQRFRHDPEDPDSLSSDTIYDLHVDATGALWIGTAGGGLDRLVGPTRQRDGYRFTNHSQNRGLTSDVIYAVHSDARGHLWLSSNNGLMRLNPSTGAIKTFHRNHGLQGDEFNYGAHDMAIDGRLYFGGPNGFNVFHPARIEENRNKPTVVLTAFEKQGIPVATDKPYALMDSIVLDYRDDVVSLEFAALDYADPDKHTYAFMLEGFDRQWLELGSVRRVTYTNLDARDYVFRVKAANSDGVWNEEGLAIPITVVAAPWATRWAYGTYAAIVAFLLAMIIRWQQGRLRREANYSRRLEAQVSERTAELQERNRELQHMSRMKSDFLARMSHEIRTPMNGVLGMTELLKRTLLNRSQARFARTIHNSAELLLQLINDILDFSRIEAGKLKLESTAFDIREVTEETVDLLANQAEERGLELVCSTPADAPIVMGDPLRIRQVLLNLVGNAIKFTERGRVLVRASWRQEGPAQGELRIEVEDTGVGIREQSVDRIFEPFSQLDESTTRIHGGSGLGLAICRQLVELMDGQIRVSSVLGEGSRFWFSVPATCVEAPELDVPRTPDLNGRSVVVVSASDAIHEALRRPLTAAGAAARFVGDPRAEADHRGIAALLSQYEFAILDLDDQTAAMLEELQAFCSTSGARRPRVILLAPGRYDPGLNDRQADIVSATVSKPVRQVALFNALVGWESEATGVLRSLGTDEEPAAGANTRLGARVLLAEDNEVNQAVAEGMLRELGCRVDVANNGRVAVEKWSDGGHDIVLMDCQMPEMDGFEATRTIRAAETGGARIPIVALTANASEGARQRCMDAGMDDYVSKPFTLAQLRDALTRHSSCSPADPSRVETVAPAPELSSIDSNALNAILALDDTGALLARVIAAYLDSAADLVHQLEAALDGSDPAALAKIAHSLKSASANVGAWRIAEASADLERFALSGRLDDATDAAFVIVEQFPVAAAALREFRNKEAA